jgi:hypothetical protein
MGSSKVAPAKPKSKKDVTADMKASKPTQHVKDDPAGLLKPIMFESTHLNFIDEILGPGTLPRTQLITPSALFARVCHGPCLTSAPC